MGSFSKNLALLAIGFWLGCAILFSIVVAPTLFNQDVTLGLSDSMRGAIVGAILRRIYFITYICIGVGASFLLICVFREGKHASKPRWALILCALLLGLNFLSDRWVLPKINKLKIQMTNSDQPQVHKEFQNWHKISTALFGSAIVCGAGAAAFLLPSSSGRSKKSK